MVNHCKALHQMGPSMHHTKSHQPQPSSASAPASAPAPSSGEALWSLPGWHHQHSCSLLLLGLFEADCQLLHPSGRQCNFHHHFWAWRGRSGGQGCKWPGHLLIVNYLQYLLRYLPFSRSSPSEPQPRSNPTASFSIVPRQFWGDVCKLVCQPNKTSGT
jgi:hypothetical protein